MHNQWLWWIVTFLVLRTISPKSIEEDLTLTRQEKSVLDKFKKRVIARLPHRYMREEVYLVRWLRARDFNMAQAELMLNDNLKWRKKNKMDTILQEDWTAFWEKYPYFLDTVSRDGQPRNFGEWDLRAAGVAGETQKLIRYINRCMEHSTATVRKFQSEGKNVSQFDFVVNMDNYNIVQHGCVPCVNFYIALVTSYENHYPNMADRIILFNTPLVFEAVLEVIRPLMHPMTRKALQVIGQNKQEWSKVLTKIADNSQRTPEYGGVYLRNSSSSQ